MPEDRLILATLAVLHGLATAWMAGLVWFVQLVHYPLMIHVPPERFVAFERSHTTRTTPITAGPMVVEALSAAAMVALGWGVLPHATLVVGAALLVVVWASTFLVQVPLHNRLLSGKNDALIARLVSTNWIRTVAWTARLVVAGLILAEVAR